MGRTQKRWLCAMLSAAMAFVLLAAPVRADDSAWKFSDTAGHWAEKEIEAASSNRHANGDRWVNGYPDGTFRPDAGVTRAEFVKMLLGAVYLHSYTDTAKFLHEASSFSKSGEAPADLDGHWLTREGWTQTALDFGLILPSDYPGGAFLPDRPASRCEAAVMIVRALGLVYPAKNSAAAEELPFTDGETIAPSLRGYVFQAVKAGVLDGYPDGSFRGEKTVTRAEAAAMVFRALAYMEEGIDRDIQVYATERSEYMPEAQKQRLKIWLTVPAQVIDSVIYIPARDLIAANAALYHGETGWSGWDTERQQLAAAYIYTFCSGAGDVRYENTPYDWSLSEWSETFTVPARLLRGELMVPVYAPGGAAQNLWGDVRWDAEAKMLVIPMGRQYTPSS